MTRLLTIAGREVRELIRQPLMIGFVGALYVFIAGYLTLAAVLVQAVDLDPVATKTFGETLVAFGVGDMAPADIVGWIVNLGNFLVFSQYLGISSVLAGHTILHERQSNTLPFLLLAPVSRAEVLLGKVLGAIALPTALYLAVATCTMSLIAALPLASPHADLLPPSPAWWVAAYLGGPIWALGVGIICATLSAMSKDVRTAQQGVWFVMFFATFSAGYLLAGRLGDGALTQLIVAALAIALAGGALLVGSMVISRELSR
ncbi:MAG: ABC transporter permease [Myxococcota bacterium]